MKLTCMGRVRTVNSKEEQSNDRCQWSYHMSTEGDKGQQLTVQSLSRLLNT